MRKDIAWGPPRNDKLSCSVHLKKRAYPHGADVRWTVHRSNLDDRLEISFLFLLFLRVPNPDDLSSPVLSSRKFNNMCGIWLLPSLVYFETWNSDFCVGMICGPLAESWEKRNELMTPATTCCCITSTYEAGAGHIRYQDAY